MKHLDATLAKLAVVRYYKWVVKKWDKFEDVDAKTKQRTSTSPNSLSASRGMVCLGRGWCLTWCYTLSLLRLAPVWWSGRAAP